MKSIICAALAAAGIVVFLSLASSNDQTESSEPANGNINDSSSPTAATTNSTLEKMPNSLESPFGKGPPPMPRTAEQRARERKLLMERNHYSTPPAYFTMSLHELQERAKQKDVFALLQLGEQYWSESEEIANDPAYDKELSPKQNAINMMIAAAGQGHSKAAALVSNMYASQGADIDAYVWSLVSERMGDSSLQAQRSIYEERLSSNQRAEAMSRAGAANTQIQNSVIAMLQTKSGKN